MTVRLEDGLYIVKHVLLNSIENAGLSTIPAFMFKRDGDWGMRFEVRNGRVQYNNYGSWTGYIEESGFWCDYALIDSLDKVKQGLLPYPERS